MALARERLSGTRSVIVAVLVGAFSIAMAVVVARGIFAAVSMHAFMEGDGFSPPSPTPAPPRATGAEPK